MQSQDSPPSLSAQQTSDEPIGKILVRLDVVDEAELARALAVQQQSGGLLGDILRKLGLVSDADWVKALAVKSGVPVVTADEFPQAPVLPDRISQKFLKERRLLPLAETADGLELAMADPLDAYAVDAVALAAQMPVLPRIAMERDIAAALDRLYASGAPLAGLVDQNDLLAVRAGEDDIERLKDLASEAPVIRLVDHILSKALEARASDVHLEPLENRLRIRFRVDGLLREFEAPPAHMAPALLSRIKILAKLNIAERRLAQDGRIRLRLQGRKVDLRIATLPSLHGESVVVRLLEQSNDAPDFTRLGLPKAEEEKLMQVLGQHDGILLVTGPTGSGKTTTLYAALSQLNGLERKIVTVEDPVEYEIPGLTQVHVNADIGLTFASLLRQIVRHDPDVIMIGEMRDYETAEIAVQSALTGHTVLSTLHTNDAPTAVTRLLEMGVEDYLLVSTLRAVIAQRLVRRLCPDCREPYQPEAGLAARLKLAELAATDGRPTLYRARGCARCQDSGYNGRVGIYELMFPDDEMRRLILSRADSMTLKQAAQQAGMRTMFDDGLAKALLGVTTLEEVGRVTHMS